MLAVIDFALEQKLALLLAMNVSDNIILEKLNISKENLHAYKLDEDFNRLVNLYKDELEADTLMAKVKDNDSMLEYYVKRKLISLIDILDKDLDFMHDRIRSNENDWETADFINGINSVTSLANVIRQLLRDIATININSGKLDLEKKRMDIGNKEEGSLSPEAIAQIKKLIRGSKEGV